MGRIASVACGWAVVAAVAFAALFDADATDDYAGWVLAVVALQVPAFVALWPGRTAGPPAGARRWAFAVAAGIAAAFAVFWIGLVIGVQIWEPEFLELRPFGLAVAATVVALGVATARFARVLREAPHPSGALRVALAVAALGAAGLAAVATLVPVDVRGDAAVWLAIGAPAAWAMPIALGAALTPPVPPARAPLPPARVR